MRQGAAIDIFQFAAQWHAVGNPAHRHAHGGGVLADEMRGGFAFDGKLDEVTVYEYALSSTQISNHYTKGTT